MTCKHGHSQLYERCPFCAEEDYAEDTEQIYEKTRFSVRRVLARYKKVLTLLKDDDG